MKDTILHGMICNKTIRFAAISGRAMVQQAKETHDLSRVAAAALGRQLLMTSLIASQMKNSTDTVTTVVSGGGPSGNLTCVGREGGLVKGYATEPRVELPLRSDGKLDVGGYVGRQGKLTVIRDLGLKEPYVGMCNLVSGEIAEDFARYFTASEQQPSLVYLGVRENASDGKVLAAGGLLIQPLPSCPLSEIEKVEQIVPTLITLTERLADDRSLREILSEFFKELQPEFTAVKEPAYLCDCNRERLERALLSIGKEELLDMIETDGKAELICQFCLKKHAFTKSDLIALLKEATDQGEEDGESGE